MSPRHVWQRGLPRLIVIVAVGGLFPMVSQAMAAEGESEGSTLAAIDALAIENNQSLHAFDARARQFGEEAAFEENLWPDPVVEYMLDVSAPWAPHFTTGHMVRVMQTVPLGGARERRGAPKRASQQVVQAQKAEATVDVLRDIRLHAVELARIDARVALLDEELGLLDDAIGIVEELTGVGEAEHGDLYQLELARETLLDRQAELESARRSRRAVLAGRLGVETDRLEGVEFSADLLDEWLVELPSRDELVELGMRAEPGIQTLEAEAVVAGTQIELVEERYRPWPRLMVGYSNMPPMWEMDGPRDQMLQVGVSISLPWFGGQYDYEASQWQAARESAEQEQAQRREEVRARIEELLIRWDADRKRLIRHETELLPLATDLAQQVLVGVEVGERSAAEFLLSVRQEIEIEGRVIELRADLLEQLIELQRWTGGRIGADQNWAYPEEVGVEQ